MKRPTSRMDVSARAVALAASIGLTSVLIGVNVVDLSTLGGHEVVTQAPTPGHTAQNEVRFRGTW